MAELWRLPAWINHGYRMLLGERRSLVSVLHIARDTEHGLLQQHKLDDDPTLRRWLIQPANTILLANGIGGRLFGVAHSSRERRPSSIIVVSASATLSRSIGRPSSRATVV